MKFIEMTGKTLAEVVKEDEMDLKAAGVNNEAIVRINEHGDIEVRRPKKWDLIGGLLGNYDERIKKMTGLEFV